MKSCLVAASGAVTALGDLETTWQALLAGRSALTPYELEGKSWPVGCIQDLQAPVGSARRVQELLERLYLQLPVLPASTDLIVSTTKAAADELLTQPTGPWPGQPWNLAAEIAGALNLQGEAVTVSAACASGTLAVLQGALRLAAGESSAVLILGLDILSRFVLSGFASLQGLSTEGCRPFDRDRDGLSLGEGTAFLLLTAEDQSRPQTPPLARLTGWGTACDANHITAPCRQASGLIAALRQTTAAKRPVGAVNAHGTGTLYNDAMELLAFGTLWPEEGPPVHSVKGAIGHCLGAAGVIEAALALQSLSAGLIPPTIGLRRAETPRASGQQPLPLAAPSVLTCNSGFGGINAGLLFEAAS